jgi:Golgi SNAP receptor complex protein 2
MNSLLAKATKQLASIRLDLAAFRDLPADQNDAGKQGTLLLSNAIGQISASLTTLGLTLRDVNDIISKEVNMERRNTGKAQYREINEEYARLKLEFDSIRAHRSEHEKKKQRQDLLTFRNPNERQPLTESSMMRQEATTLEYGQQKIEDFIAMGQQALESLQLQRSTFKGMERRVLDVAQRLGVSDGVIRVIQSRQGTDWFIFWGCVLFALFFLLWIIYKSLF